MNTFIVSDLHLGHARTLSMPGCAGGVLRAFPSVEAMDEAMICRWNNRVRPKDLVYVVGDVAIHRAALARCLPRLAGRKRLVMGNHDTYARSDNNEYAPYFEQLHGAIKLANLLLTHYPVHPGSIPAHCIANVHGHLHDREVMLDGVPDTRYFNVSVERLNYTPLSIEEVQAAVLTRQALHSPCSQKDDRHV